MGIMKRRKLPQITLITLIFYFFIICVNLCNLWTILTGGKDKHG
jgi:hypothetical protein